MLIFEQITEVNSRIKKINLKGKEYACVPGRVQAFRELCPTGSIRTEILSMENNVVVIKATILDHEGRILATGIASEKEGSSNVNKTSYIENCETSAVGRALGFIGIGSAEEIASAEEFVSAKAKQADDAKSAEVEQLLTGILKNIVIKNANENPDKVKADSIARFYGKESITALSSDDCIDYLSKMAKKGYFKNE